MTWFRFDKPFDFSPPARKGFVTISYQPGLYNVTRECAAAAKKAEAGQAVKPRKEASNGEEAGRR
jgi:hypothetical protein